MTAAVDILHALGACEEEGGAIPWVEAQSESPDAGPAPEQLWPICPRGDWLLWLLTHWRVLSYLPEPDRRLRLIACDIAETMLPPFEAERPDDARPRTAIEVSRRYAEGRATDDELRAANTAAAKVDVRGSWPTWAAQSAATAATSATSAAAWGVSTAAELAASDAAHADIVRRYYSWQEVRRALEAAGLVTS